MDEKAVSASWLFKQWPPGFLMQQVHIQAPGGGVCFAVCWLTEDPWQGILSISFASVHHCEQVARGWQNISSLRKRALLGGNLNNMTPGFEFTEKCFSEVLRRSAGIRFGMILSQGLKENTKRWWHLLEALGMMAGNWELTSWSGLCPKPCTLGDAWIWSLPVSSPCLPPPQ